MSITINGTTGIIADSPATVKANAYLDAAGGNTATINGAIPASLASPALTGTPTAPTAAVATNTTQIATTAFVLANAPATGIQTFTASGSITAGNGLSLKSDGTVCKIEKTTSFLDKSYNMATTSDTTLPNYYPVSGPNNGDINTGVIPLSNTTFLSVVRQNGGVFAMYARIITIASDGTVTFTSNTLIPIPQSYNIDMILKIAPDKFAMFYDTDSLKTYCIVGQVTGSTISFGASVLFQTGYSTDVYAAASNNNGTFIVQYFGAASTYSTLVQAFTVSGTTISVGGTVALRSSLPRYWNGAFGYDPVGDVFLFNINQDTTPYTINSFALKVTGTTITAGSQQQLFGAPTGGSSQKARLMYNTSLGRFIVVNPYLTASTSRLFSATIASTTITASAQTTDLPFAVPNGFIATSNGSLLLDRNAAGTLYQITVDPANSYKPIATLLPLTGVLTASSTAIGTGGVYAFNTSTGGVQTVTTQAFTTLTTFLGTANETVTTGQPVKVAVTGGGGIATGLSGLTTTTRYYYANDGTVVPQGSASAVANAGVAISATTLLQI